MWKHSCSRQHSCYCSSCPASRWALLSILLSSAPLPPLLLPHLWSLVLVRGSCFLSAPLRFLHFSSWFVALDSWFLARGSCLLPSGSYVWFSVERLLFFLVASRVVQLRTASPPLPFLPFLFMFLAAWAMNGDAYPSCLIEGRVCFLGAALQGFFCLLVSWFFAHFWLAHIQLVHCFPIGKFLCTGCKLSRFRIYSAFDCIKRVLIPSISQVKKSPITSFLSPSSLALQIKPLTTRKGGIRMGLI